MGKMSFCHAVFSKKKGDGEIEKQSFLSLESGNISVSPQTKIMPTKFNVAGVLLYSPFVPLDNKNSLLKVFEWNYIL